MECSHINEEFWDNFERTLNQTLVPNISNQTIRPCVNEDFQDFKKTLINNFYTILKELDIIKNEEHWCEKTKDNLIKVIVIIGEQHIISAWNNHEIVELSKLLTSKVCKFFKTENITEVLKNDDIFLKIILFLRPKLLKDTWKSSPASVVCYQWLLESVDKLLLKEHVPEILPTALIIFDDYVVENQVVGLKCINLIIECSQKCKILKNCNYDEVIFQALKKMIYKVESHNKSTIELEDIITILYSCISNLLNYIEYYENNNSAFEWTKRDDILAILLDNMESQINSEFQYCYIKCISRIFINNSSGKWSGRLGRILSEYCENYINLNTTKVILDFIESFLSIYQPKGSNFYTSLYSSLIKLRYKLILLDTDIKIIATIDERISLLNRVCSNSSKEIFENIKIQSIMNVT